MLTDNAGIWSFHFTNTFSGHECITSIGAVFPNAYTIADYLATAIDLWGTNAPAAAPFRATMRNSDWSWSGTSVIGKKGGLIFTDAGAGNGAGTVSASSPSINTSVKVKKGTGIAGRKYRGVMMVPPFWLAEGTEVDSGGNLDSTRITALNSSLNSVRGQMVGNGVTPILIHGDGSAPTTITSLTVQGRVGTVGRRMR